MRRLLFIMLTLLVTTAGAQEKLVGHYEPFLKLEYDVTENYSHEFKVENRVNLYDNNDFQVKAKQLDIAHFSTLKLNANHAMAVGIQYRFEEDFGGNDENELRFTEEYKIIDKSPTTQIKHRLRAEQRLTSTSTSHRFRYKFELARPLNRTNAGRLNPHIIGSLETLLTVAGHSGPEYEQRIGGGIELSLTDFAAFEVGIEYRLDDFTKNLGHELFFVTGMSFEL